MGCGIRLKAGRQKSKKSNPQKSLNTKDEKDTDVENKRERMRERQYVATLSGESVLPLSDEKSICYRAVINYVPKRMVEGAWGLVCTCVCHPEIGHPPG